MSFLYKHERESIFAMSLRESRTRAWPKDLEQVFSLDQELVLLSRDQCCLKQLAHRTPAVIQFTARTPQCRTST